MAARLGVASALIEGRWLAGDVVIDDGVIRDVGLAPAPGGRCAVPGFVDLQVNGWGGVELATAEIDDYRRAARQLASAGVTSFAPTIPTADPSRYDDALAIANRFVRDPGPGAARPIGVHLEGPFLSDGKRGAHRADWLQEPSVALVDRWCAAAPVAIMTLAPELPGAPDVIAALGSRGVVVSAGHTEADAAAARRAFDAGVSMVTHLWNAQHQMASRQPGLVGVALARPEVMVGLIADLVHVAAETLVVSLRAAGDRAVIVSDASPAAGLADGPHDLGGRSVVVDGAAVRLPDGTLSGSATGLDGALRALAGIGLDPATVIGAMTSAPARAVRRHDLGRLSVGGVADVVVLEDDLTINSVLIGGTPC